MVSKAGPPTSRCVPGREPSLYIGGEVLSGFPSNQEANPPTTLPAVLRKGKKTKPTGPPVETIPEETETTTRRIGDCDVFLSAHRWTLRLTEWFEKGEDCWHLRTLRSPLTIPDCWEERIIRLQTRDLEGTREDRLREGL